MCQLSQNKERCKKRCLTHVIDYVNFEQLLLWLNLEHQSKLKWGRYRNESRSWKQLLERIIFRFPIRLVILWQTFNLFKQSVIHSIKSRRWRNGGLYDANNERFAEIFPQPLLAPLRAFELRTRTSVLLWIYSTIAAAPP